MEQLINFVMQHPYLWGGVVLITILLVLLEFETKWQGIRRIGVSDLSLLMNREGIVVDINESNDFTQGHILGAIHVPFSQWSQKVTSLDKHKSACLILVSNQERQAIQAAKILKQQEFKNVAILAGGLTAWREANLPLVRKDN